MAVKIQQYTENGVTISKTSLYPGDKVTISYDGLLTKNGADQVFIHLGYGDLWDEKEFIPMENEGGIFKGSFSIKASDTLNMAFKDAVGNWDNNSNNNYSFKISKKATKSKKEVVEEKAIPAKTTSKKASAKSSATETKATKTASVKATTAKTTKKATEAKTAKATKASATKGTTAKSTKSKAKKTEK